MSKITKHSILKEWNISDRYFSLNHIYNKCENLTLCEYEILTGEFKFIIGYLRGTRNAYSSIICIEGIVGIDALDAYEACCLALNDVYKLQSKFNSKFYKYY